MRRAGEPTYADPFLCGFRASDIAMARSSRLCYSDTPEEVAYAGEDRCRTDAALAKSGTQQVSLGSRTGRFTPPNCAGAAVSRFRPRAGYGEPFRAKPAAVKSATPRP